MFGSVFATLPPLRASADVNPCRVIKRSGTFTGAQATGPADIPLGISAEWSRLPPIVMFSPSGLHAKGTDADPITYNGRGSKCHADVGTALTASGLVMSDANGKLQPYVSPGWYVGFNLAPAVINSKVEVFVDPGYIGATLAQTSFAGLKVLRGVGVAAPGAVTLTGTTIGMRLVGVFGELTAGGALIGVANDGSVFESTITVADQIQQVSASDLHLNNYVFLLAPALV